VGDRSGRKCVGRRWDKVKDMSAAAVVVLFLKKEPHLQKWVWLGVVVHSKRHVPDFAGSVAVDGTCADADNRAAAAAVAAGSVDDIDGEGVVDMMMIVAAGGVAEVDLVAVVA
jgi:hypothetical protein